MTDIDSVGQDNVAGVGAMNESVEASDAIAMEGRKDNNTNTTGTEDPKNK